MTGPKENFEQYAQMAEMLSNEQEEQHAKNADPNSHLHPGGIFDSNKRVRGNVLLASDGEDIESERTAQRSLKRQAQISKVVEDALVNRVQAPTGVNIMKVSWDEHMKMRSDPNFESFAKYAPNILNKRDANGNLTPRDRPLRPFMQNEIGMYQGRIVVLDRMPGDSPRGDIPYVQVKEKLDTDGVGILPGKIESFEMKVEFEVHDGKAK